MWHSCVWLHTNPSSYTHTHTTGMTHVLDSLSHLPFVHFPVFKMLYTLKQRVSKIGSNLVLRQDSTANRLARQVEVGTWEGFLLAPNVSRCFPHCFVRGRGLILSSKRRVLYFFVKHGALDKPKILNNPKDLIFFKVSDSDSELKSSGMLRYVARQISLGRWRHEWEDNIKVDLKLNESVDWINLP